MRHKLFKNDTKKSKNITRYGCLKEIFDTEPAKSSLPKRLVNPFRMAREVSQVFSLGL